MLDPATLGSVEARLRAVEERTGVQIVVAALDRADLYHGLRWRAFALGAATAGALVVLVWALRPAWDAAAAPLWSVVAVLGAGLLLALAATLSPAASRLFLEPLRAEAEVRERAAAIFLERELFATRDRTAVLLLACSFERLAAVRADRGFEGRVSEAEWRTVEQAMGARLAAGRQADALLSGLEALEGLLVGKGFAPGTAAGNDLPDRPLCGPGAQ